MSPVSERHHAAPTQAELVLRMGEPTGFPADAGAFFALPRLLPAVLQRTDYRYFSDQTGGKPPALPAPTAPQQSSTSGVDASG